MASKFVLVTDVDNAKLYWDAGLLYFGYGPTVNWRRGYKPYSQVELEQLQCDVAMRNVYVLVEEDEICG